MKRKVKIISIVFIFVMSVLFAIKFNTVFASTDSIMYSSNEYMCMPSPEAQKIRKIIDIMEIIVMAIGLGVLFILLPKNIIKKKSLQKRIKEIEATEESEDTEKNVLVKKLRKTKAFIVLNIVFGIFAFFAASVLYIIPRFAVAAKPIIYLYPETEQVVSVSLGYPEKLTCTYPKYNDSWKVLAKPNGDLLDLKTNRSLYALYWEGKNTNNTKITEGFCVKGEDVAYFLEEKLAVLGLSDREAEEFIIYWLPKLERNKYNLIRFKTIEEINENMSLTIEPKPDTVIRVFMEFKASNKFVSLPAQELVTPERKGFVAVEWGGTEIK